mmetsp:Transcript_25406/g.70740  ORF Transcript_25406/g.70740 Transcript_25406/m.70740 type:complete len:1016 (+) Transcript_25406:90-3137(+)
MATIQVALRCRPFTLEDRLGVQLIQTGEDPPTGEVNLLNSQIEGDRARFAFNYAWWSAFNFKRKLLGEEMALADDMRMMSQEDVYKAVGPRIKEDFLAGNAVVMFAYGLSGSGKTFTVFGPDAVDSPDAWFKHSEPHHMWGILPHMAYELFCDKKEDWKISMKYFQNVVDIVRDLMAPNAEEKHYKQGMHKDEDGFTDIDWCKSKVLHSWNDFREEFMRANTRKAISPTQFNHQSTRGHCIMTLELERPFEDDPSRKQRGRLYICDLAGTEPAGDIYYAQYKVVDAGDGQKEYQCTGPHPDRNRTKELQDQGKKINLSLSEMAQFFMKMADAVMKNKLRPGATIPGCNSFFLCKYLKDTLLQAKTYLFCAIRPEVEFHKYTFSTLGFAKNASVIKVQPKKATTAMSAAERKLMQELDAIRLQMERLKQENAQLAGTSTGGGGFSEEDLENAVAEKIAEMRKVQENESKGANDESEADLREKYAKYGMALVQLDGGSELPHFTNLDIDSFRNGVFMFILSKPEMTFGPHGDFRPQSLSVVPDHCTVIVGFDSVVAVKAGKGPTYLNGKMLKVGETQALNAFDRLAVGSELLLLRMPGNEPEDVEPPTAEIAVDEYREALVASAAGAPEAEATAPMPGGLSEEASKRVDGIIKTLHPKLKQATELCNLIDPDTALEFKLTLAHADLTTKGPADNVEVRVIVTNPASTQSISLSENEFSTVCMLLNDELTQMRHAAEYGGEHVVDTNDRPVARFFDHMVHLGTCLLFTEFLLYNMETDPNETSFKIFDVTGTKGKVDVGRLEAIWTPLANPDDDGTGQILEVYDPAELIGKPWTFRFAINKAVDLTSNVFRAYVEYNFLGERFTTEVVEIEKGTRNPDFQYSFVHHVSCVDQTFLDTLQKPFELRLFTTPFVLLPPTGISTQDPGVAERLRGDDADPSGPGCTATDNVAVEWTQADEPSGTSAEDQLRKQLARANLDKAILCAKVKKLEQEKADYLNGIVPAASSGRTGGRSSTCCMQ